MNKRLYQVKLSEKQQQNSPTLPMLSDETYTLIRKDLFSSLTEQEHDRLEDLIINVSVRDIKEIIRQIKEQQKNILLE